MQMVALYRDPQGKKIFGNVIIHSPEDTEKVTLQAERSRILALEKEIQSLQTQLKQQHSVSITLSVCKYCSLRIYVLHIQNFSCKNFSCQIFLLHNTLHW